MSRPGRTALLAAVILSCAAAAAAGEWRETDTAHFRFIFEPRDQASVDELLVFCEEVYSQVTAFWGSRPAVVPCIIRGRRDDANGVTESFPFRIELYVTAPTDFVMGTRSSWLRLLLTHELTHFVHETMDTGLLHEASRLFGAEVTSAGLAFLPGWAVEGPAVYDETELTEGGRGRSALFEICLKAAAEEDRFFSLEQAGYPSDLPPPDRIYVGGWALSSWLQETYGPETLRRIMDAYLSFPFLGPWSAISRVTGRSAAAIYSDMTRALRQRYAAAGQISGGTRLTPAVTGSWSHPLVTPAGLIAWHTGPDLYPSFVRIEPSNGSEVVLGRAALTDASSFCATPDGRRIWFSSFVVDYRRPDDVRTVSELFVLDTTTHAVRQLTHGAHVWHPAVSGDGRRLVAVQGVGPYSRLVAVDTVTGAVRALFAVEQGNVYNPAFSPNGERVAFVLNVRGMQGVSIARTEDLERSSVALADPAGPVAALNADMARAVTGPEPFGDYYPAFMDEKRLLFSSDRTGAVCLYAADLDTGDVSLIQQDPVAAIAGAVQGTTLFYQGYTTQGYCLKRSSLSAAPLSWAAPQVAAAASAPAAAASPAAPPAESPSPPPGAPLVATFYHDVPTPLVWLPDLILRQTGPSGSDLSLGAGAWVGGASLLGASQWEMDAAWMPGPSQLSAGATLSVDVDAVQMAVASRLDYSYSSTWTQTVDSSLSMQYPLLAESGPDSFRQLSASAGVTHHAERSASAPFPFTSSLSAPGSDWYTWVSVPAAVAWQWNAGTEAAALVPAPAVNAWVRATTFLPVLSLPATEEQLDVLGEVRLPTIGHQSVAAGVKLSQDFGPAGPAGTGSFTSPRGFGSRTQPLPGAVLGSIDYLLPLLLDQPLALGVAMTAAAFDLHAEALADFDAAAGLFTTVPAVFAGAELTARFVYGTFELPLGIGVTAALRGGAAGFDASRDLRIYLTAGFDSQAGPSDRASLHPAGAPWYISGNAR